MPYYLDTREQLAGERVNLRLPEPADIAFVQRLWLDEETMRPVGGPVDATIERLQAWYARMVDPGRPTDLYCLICMRETGGAIGEVSFHRLDQAAMSAYLNIKVASVCRGQGYGKDALAVFLRFFFVPLGGRELLDDVALANTSGRRLLEAMGFERDPHRHEVALMRLTRARFLELTCATPRDLSR